MAYILSPQSTHQKWVEDTLGFKAPAHLLFQKFPPSPLPKICMPTIISKLINHPPQTTAQSVGLPPSFFLLVPFLLTFSPSRWEILIAVNERDQMEHVVQHFSCQP